MPPARRGAEGRQARRSRTGCGWSPATSAPASASSTPASSLIGSHELFHKDLLPPGVKAARGEVEPAVESRAIDTFLDLNEGDYVVHVAHGIARFRGMRLSGKGVRSRGQ